MSDSVQNKIWELTASKIHNEADENETGELTKLLRYPENNKIFEGIDNLHKKLPETKPLIYSSSFRSWQKITQYLDCKKTKLYLNITKYAAIILFAFGIGTFLQIYHKPVQTLPIIYSEVYVPPGQMSEITLPDGTHIWLNSETKLRYTNSFGQDERMVELIGEAFFKVKKKEIPFRVKMKNHEIEVLGTTFAAETYSDENFSRVTLIEGAVQINNPSGEKLKQLKPQQQITLPDDIKKKIITNVVNTTFYESWINGEIKFDDEKLSDVARRMERWYNVEIKFAKDELKNLRFTGTVLKNKPVDQSMKAICLLLGVKADFQSNLNTKDIITISKI